MPSTNTQNSPVDVVAHNALIITTAPAFSLLRVHADRPDRWSVVISGTAERCLLIELELVDLARVLIKHILSQQVNEPWLQQANQPPLKCQMLYIPELLV